MPGTIYQSDRWELYYSPGEDAYYITILRANAPSDAINVDWFWCADRHEALRKCEEKANIHREKRLKEKAKT